MGKGRGRGRVGKVVSGHINALYGRNGTFCCGGNPFLQFSQIRRQRRLITYGRWHPAKKRRYLGASLGKTEDVVYKEKHVLSFRVAEILRDGQRRQSHSGSCSRGLRHLSVNKSCLLDNAGFLHFKIEIVSL